jgi:endo-1,4-beta-xylanase
MGIPPGSKMTRRESLYGLGALSLSAAAAMIAPRHANGTPDREMLPALRTRTARSRIKFGCAAAAPGPETDAVLLEKVATEANIFVPEGALKWDQTEPQPNDFDFSAPDRIMDFADRHDMKVHGPTLVWYAAIPDWVSQLTTGREAEAALERHIVTQVSRYRGKIWAWDVVNEPMEPEDRLEFGYRNSVWQRLLGIEYVDRAFRLARSADPRTPLCLNEYGFEYTSAKSSNKRQALLALLRKLRDLDTPIDCLGLQSHLECDQVFDRQGFSDFLKSVVELDFKLLITELDVNDVHISGNEFERDVAVDRHAAEFLEIVFSVTRPTSIATWGLSDRYTWMKTYYKRADGKPLRPLPLDASYNRKMLWSTIGRYLSA